MTKEREALKLALEYIETNAHERRHVRWAIKEALAQPEQVSEYECRKLLYGFMLDCNAVGLEQAGKNLHRSMKEKNT